MRRKRYDEVATKNPLRGPCSVVYHDVADSPAFKAMRPHAKLAVVMVKRSYNRTTQKAVPVSARVIAKLTGVSNNKGLSLMKEAMHYGFWRLHTAGRLGVDGKGIATFVRLTDERFNGDPATLDFLKWDGTRFHEQKPPSYYKRRERGLVQLKAHKAKIAAAKKTESRLVRQHTPVPSVQDTPVLYAKTPNAEVQQKPVSSVQDISKNSCQLNGSTAGTDAAPSLRSEVGAGPKSAPTKNLAPRWSTPQLIEVLDPDDAYFIRRDIELEERNKR